MIEGIISTSQEGAKRVHYFGEFKSQTSQGRDFRGFQGCHGRLMQATL